MTATTITYETVGPLNEAVPMGASVWLRWNSRVWDAVLIGPGEHDYEVHVRFGSEREEMNVHRYNVQPQERAS